MQSGGPGPENNTTGVPPFVWGVVDRDRFLPVWPANNQHRVCGKPKLSAQSGGKLPFPGRDFLVPPGMLGTQVYAISPEPQ
jgi:hypothetical protein